MTMDGTHDIPAICKTHHVYENVVISHRDDGANITTETSATIIRKQEDVKRQISCNTSSTYAHERQTSSYIRRSALSRYFTWRYIVNHKQKLTFYTILMLINILLFCVAAAIYYPSNGAMVLAKGTGLCLDFNCAIVGLMMFRYCLTKLRATRVGKCLPLDHNISIHQMIGWLIGIQSIMHTVAHLVNVALVIDEWAPTSDHVFTCAPINQSNWTNSSDQLQYWEYLFTDRSGIGWFGPGYAFLTGITLVLVLTILALLSLPLVRNKRHFQLFYWSHKLYIPFWILMILHSPLFGYFFIAPGILLIVENIVRCGCVSRAKFGDMQVKKVELMSSEVTHLVISRGDKFNFKPGDYVYIRIPDVAKYEWHPFTISSAPEMRDEISLHIRSVGNWTKKLYDYFEERLLVESEETSECSKTFTRTSSSRSHRSLRQKIHPERQRSISFSDPVDHPSGQIACGMVDTKVHIEGPYGVCPWNNHHSPHVVLIGTGIGVTPIASILQSIMINYRASRQHTPQTCGDGGTSTTIALNLPRKVDFIWINRDDKCFEWFTRLLTQLELDQFALDGNSDVPYLDIALYMTARRHTVVDVIDVNSSATEARLASFKSVFDHSRRRHGRPDWNMVFRKIKSKNIGKVTVFFCGARVLANIISEHCDKSGFKFFKETFY